MTGGRNGHATRANGRHVQVPPQSRPANSAAPRRRAYALAALEAEATKVAATAEGSRNPTLNAAAFALGTIIGADPDALAEAEAVARLMSAARESGLAEREAHDTVRSGLEAGMKCPRDLAGVGVGAEPRPIARPTAPTRRDVPTQIDNKRQRALALWQASGPMAGTPGTIYLAARGLGGDIPPALRFNHAAPMPDGGRHQALVAAVTVPTTGEIIAVQRTALRPDGSAKAAIEPACAALGETRGGAVVLGDLSATAGEIIEGEGIETVLSAVQATSQPGIATLSSSTLGRPALPPGRPIVILVDPGAEVAAAAAAKRRHAEGRAVRLAHVPDDVRPGVKGTDANDLLRERGPEAVRAMLAAARPWRADPPEPAPLPWGFARKSDGWIVYRAGPPGSDSNGNDGDGPDVWADLCSPLEFVAATRDSDGRAWGLLARVQNPDGSWAEVALPSAWQAGDGRETRAALLAAGLRLAHGSGARAALARLVATVEPAARVRSVSRVGWHGRAFVLPETAIGDTGGERTIWQSDTALQHSYRLSGTLDGWRIGVAAPCAGNSRLVLALSAAFATPLLEVLGLESGGLHVRGPSSLGKTTLLRVAGSVWGGGGIGGYIRRWRATANGLEAVAALHCDSLLCLDELAEIDGRDAYRAAYMLANGQGKARAGQTGEARAAQTWRLLFLSTGELSLADKVAEDGRRATAGQEVRVVDIAADAGAGLGLFERLHEAPDPAAFARRISDASAAHYGHPVLAFLEALTTDPDGSAGHARATMHAFETTQLPANATGQVQRVLARFALVAAGGELAIRHGILPWSEGEALAAAGRCLRDWLAAHGGAGNQEAEHAVAQVRAFIEAHGASRFAPASDPDRVTVNRVGFLRGSTDGGRSWLVLPEAWRTEVCRGLDPVFVARTLAERGMLRADSGSHQVRHRISGMGQIRVYEITARLLEGACSSAEAGDAAARPGSL